MTNNYARYRDNNTHKRRANNAHRVFLVDKSNGKRKPAG